MKHIAGWFRRNNTLMAQAKDLQRQLQEAWDAEKALRVMNGELLDTQLSLTSQLHRLSRERFQERELRLAAEELRDTYLEQLEEE